jgi:hypothetical protein
VQLLCIGVIGEYLAKIYLEVKARPRFVVERMAGRQAGNQDGETTPSAVTIASTSERHGTNLAA